MYRKHFGLTHHPSARRSPPTISFCRRPPATRRAAHPSARPARRRLVTGDSGSGKPARVAGPDAAPHRPLSRHLRLAPTGKRHGPLQDDLLEMGFPVERSRAALYRQIKSEVSRSVPMPGSGPCSSSTRRITSGPRSSKISASSPTTRWTRRPPLPPPARPDGTPAPPDHGRARSLAQARRGPLPHDAAHRDELPAYLAHRCAWPGAEVPLFDPTAEEALYQATSGLPAQDQSARASHTDGGRPRPCQAGDRRSPQGALPEVA